MKNYFVAAALLMTALACEKKSTEKINTATTPPDSVVVPETNEPLESSTRQSCYIGAVGKDSVFMSIDDNLGTITGKLRYKNFEKDSSFGDVAGSQNGDTLKLFYTFQSEGMTSNREIYFLRKDGNLLEGIGEQKTEGNDAVYINPSKLKFENGHTMRPTECEGFEKKFVN
ncbi:hypothetical protein [Chryseobacterium sp.]|uniref:hypothetical protein n=1 Tax=Chryseobacterium sp. TaxID=1871047 RepID=UPI001624061F|nr:hypothetical protein [Chryseobacterium sp.]